MNLQNDKTIFDKIGTEYDIMKNLPNPILPVVNYYKENLKAGESLWWIDNVESDSDYPVPITVRLWNTLAFAEKKMFIVKEMIYFPEIFSSNNRKYDRFILWLITSNSIVSTNMRDSFSAGGKVTIGYFENLPHIFKVVDDLKDDISSQLLSEPENILLSFWGDKDAAVEQRLTTWIGIVSKKCGLDYEYSRQVLNTIFNVE